MGAGTTDIGAQTLSPEHVVWNSILHAHSFSPNSPDSNTSLQGSWQGHIWGEVGQLGDSTLSMVCPRGIGHHIYCYCRSEPPGKSGHWNILPQIAIFQADTDVQSYWGSAVCIDTDDETGSMHQQWKTACNASSPCSCQSIQAHHLT